MNQLPQLEYITWSDFHTMGFELADLISKDPTKLDTIVSVSRGGHVLARILSDLLNLPIYSVSIQAYKTINTQQELVITQELAVDLSGLNILLVDEVIDSGRTLIRSLDYLTELKANKIVSVAAHVKPVTIARPDYFIKETTNWVVYPYEVRETIDALYPIWTKFGKTKAELEAELINQGKFPTDFTKTYLKQLN